jgi:ribosomal protein L35AE/L33A
MMISIRIGCLALLLMSGFTRAAAQSEPACPVPPEVDAPVGVNFFTPQQEIELGDILAEQLEHRYRLVEDDALTAYLNHAAQRILEQLPPNELHFQVFLYDDSEANAFSLPGGRIYISRKLVAFVHNEDELAGLLGHEMGHIISRQMAIQQSALLQKVLGVTAVTDRQDIASKYNQLLDNAARKPEVFRQIMEREEAHQYVADRIALYAEANAGYSPQALLAFWDRFAQTHGNSGGTFSVWFGLTTPEQKRLGEMRKSLAAMPPSCLMKTGTTAGPDFFAWQAAVVDYSGPGHRESLPGMLSKKTLNPPLRGDLTTLKFSGDGKYALAQDDSSIFVLSRDPFALLFRFDAPDAVAAQFTPDSKDIVYNTRALRVENWNIESRKRLSAHEVTILGGCTQSLLSPDGKYLACLSESFDFKVYAIASSELIFSKKQFFTPGTFSDLLQLFLLRLDPTGEVQLIHIGFSTDARYVVASHGPDSVAIDLTTRSPVAMHGSLHSDVGGGFAFITPDTLVVEDRYNTHNSAIVQFPSGKILQKVLIGDQRIAPAAHGDFLLLRPLADAPVGVFDLKSQKLILAHKKTAALDVYDQQFIVERTSGEVDLMDLVSRTPLAKVELSLGPLSGLLAKAVSPDFKWLALSGSTRGAVWQLEPMTRDYFLRSFHGAYFDGDRTLFADFPKEKDVDRTIARADLARQDLNPGIPIPAETSAVQYGPLLMIRKPAGKDHDLFQNLTLETQNARTGQVLWSTTFSKEAPEIFVTPEVNRVSFEWRLDENAAKAEVRKNPALQTRYAATKDPKWARLIEVVEGDTGKPAGVVLVDTGKGSFTVSTIFAAADWVFVGDGANRTLIYSLSTGELKGTVFGSHTFAPATGQSFAVQPTDSEIQFYALPSLEKRGRLVFSSPIAMKEFAADSARIFVLTKNQDCYTFDAKAVVQSGTNSAQDQKQSPAAK